MNGSPLTTARKLCVNENTEEELVGKFLRISAISADKEGEKKMRCSVAKHEGFIVNSRNPKPRFPRSFK